MSALNLTSYARAGRINVQSIFSLLLHILLLCFFACASNATSQVLPGTISPNPAVTPPPSPDAVPPPPEGEIIDDASFVTTNMPSTIVAGTSMTVTFTMRNTGSTTWSSSGAHPYALGSASPNDNLVWGVGRAYVGGPVYFSQLHVFYLNITAPSTPGIYSFDWQMLTEGEHWFGSVVPHTVTVTAAPSPIYDSQLTSASIPAQMTAGGTYNISLTFKNTGTVIWTQPEYRIGSKSPDDNVTFGLSRVDLNVASVAPGQSVTFTYQVTAPNSAGTYLFDWGMLWEHQMRFGQTTSTYVTVNPAQSTPTPTISVTNSPAPTAGNAFTTTWSTTNATSLTHICSASGTGYNVNESLQVNGSRSQTALAAWVDYPSACAWTAIGAGGSTTYTETLRTCCASTPKPTISVTESPAPTAGNIFTTIWSTSNATSLTHVCSAPGTGYTINESLQVNGSRSQTAQAAWIGYPSTCVWTATGAGGSTTYTETLQTCCASTSKPTISVVRNPAPLVGQSFTTTWTTTDATSLSHVCTAQGTGYTVNESLQVNGSRTETAQSAWVGYPSSCTWTAIGAGGTTTFSETLSIPPASNGNVSYIHTDGLGSPVARTDASRNVIDRTRYEPYGLVAAGSQPTVGFTGHVNDTDTGLTYMQQRYYDPVAGRFLSVDPMDQDVSNMPDLNKFAYANQNPFKFLDLDGREDTPVQTVVITGQRPPPPPPIQPSELNIRTNSLVQPRSSPKTDWNSMWQTFKSCAKDELGLGDLASIGAVASGWPIPGTKRFVTPGSSVGTSIASMSADKIFGQARFPMRVPTIVGGLGTGRAFAIAYTKSVARFAGRAVPVVGWGMLAYDGVMIADCVWEGS